MKSTAKTFNPVLLVYIIPIAIIGVVLVATITRWGPGLFDLDSFNYLASARNLAAGNGLQIPVSPTALRPMLNFAPFFPTVLALFDALTVDAMDAARWLNAGLFGVNLVLFAAIVADFSRSGLLVVLSSLIFVFSADLVEAHAWALSEPLLITFMLASLLAFQKWQRSNELVWLAVLLASIGVAVLTKFVAMALVPVYVLLFIVSSADRKKKIVGSLGAILAGLLPFLAWSLRSFLLSDSFHGFSFGYIPLERRNLISAFFTFHTWFIPESWLVGRELVFLIVVIFLLIAAMAYLLTLARKNGMATLTVPVFTVVLFVCYMFVVVFSKIMFDHGIGFQDRMLIPLFPFLLANAIFVVEQLIQNGKQWPRWLGAAAVGYLAIVSAMGSLDALPTIYEEGLGWNSRQIVTSQAIAELKQITSDVGNLVFSNETYGMYFHTEQLAYGLGGFPPAEDEVGIYLVIFKIHRNDPHPLPSRFADRLELVAEDEVLSIHLFEPD